MNNHIEITSISPEDTFMAKMTGERMILNFMTDKERKDNAAVSPELMACDVKAVRLLVSNKIDPQAPKFELTSLYTLKDEMLYPDSRWMNEVNNKVAGFVGGIARLFHRPKANDFMSTLFYTRKGGIYTVDRVFSEPLDMIVFKLTRDKRYTYNGLEVPSGQYVCIPLQDGKPDYANGLTLSTDDFHKYCYITESSKKLLERVRAKKAAKKNKDAATLRIVARIVDDMTYKTTGYIVSYYDRQERRWVEKKYRLEAIKTELIKNNIRNAKAINTSDLDPNSPSYVSGFELTYGNIISLPTYYMRVQRQEKQPERKPSKFKR